MLSHVLLQASGCVPIKRGERNKALCDRFYGSGDEGEALGDDRDGKRDDERSGNVRDVLLSNPSNGLPDNCTRPA